MTVLELIQFVSAAIPVATFLALGLSVYLFVKNKGTKDALQEALQTYKQLSEAYLAKIEQLETDLDHGKIEIEDLKKQLEIERLAFKKAIDELIAALQRAGIKGGIKDV
jgi:ribosomal protein S3